MKKKIDNRALCKRLKNCFNSYKIRRGYDVKKVMEDIVNRTGHG